jgi:hypothetical protein
MFPGLRWLTSNAVTLAPLGVAIKAVLAGTVCLYPHARIAAGGAIYV